MTLGERIRTAREFRQVSQSELARRLGKTRQYLFQIEHDDHMPGAELLGEIAKALRVNGNYLLGLSEEMDPDARRRRLAPTLN
jgi:transcriptional regulator with XRE-family HTH domain